MGFLIFWLVPAFISLVFFGILVYQKNPTFRSKGELLGAVVMALIPIINLAAVLAATFILFEKQCNKFSAWLDSPVYGTDGKDW